MITEQFNELASLKAAGALDEEDVARFNDLLSSCDGASKSAATSLQDAAAVMAVAQSPLRTPSAALKAKIMARIKTTTKVPTTVSQFFSIGRDEGEWETLPILGVRVKTLSENPRSGTSVKLYELAPGTRFPGHHHSGPEECFVVSGDFHVQSRVLHAGDFHHAEPESDHQESFTEHGCTLLVMVSTSDYA